MASLVNRLLFATDFSDAAHEAEAYAVSFAAIYQATVKILHVLELYPGMDPHYPINQTYLDQLRNDTDARLAETVGRFRSKQLIAKGEQIIGIPSAQICEHAKEFGADLIVLGTRGKTALEHLLLGSTAERVIRRAPCPVLAIHPLASPPSKERSADVRHILAPIDFSDCSLDALEYAVQLAKQWKAVVTIFHVVEPMSYSLDLALLHTADAERTVARLKTELDALVSAVAVEGISAHRAIQGGTPADSLLDFISTNRCDLVVMGTHGRRGLSHLVNGSVAEAVVRRSPCPVLTVRSPKFAPGHQRIVSKT